MSQSARSIMLVRPANFVYNAETAVSNAFQVQLQEDPGIIRERAFAEFDAFAEKLRAKGVDVIVFEDTPSPQKPDAVFPNNWVTFHPDGTVILYPMHATNRRAERRMDIIESLRKDFKINNVIDLSGSEKDSRFLEGTGSVIFDHVHKIAYACLSPRTDKDLFIELCERLNYKPVHFTAHDRNGTEIYHSNVMMCIGEGFAVICLSSITNPQEMAMVTDSLQSTGHEIIDISFEQMNRFAGNMLTLQAQDGRTLLALSESAFDSLTSAHRSIIRKYCETVPLPIPTIETIGGGSARCMIAEIFLKRR